MLGNFWFGLEKVHRLTSQRRHELRVELTHKEIYYFAHYDNFTLLGETENYVIRVAGYHGTASDGLGHYDNMPFTTRDRDNDRHDEICATLYHGGWWYGGCPHAHSNLNGLWDSKVEDEGLTWYWAGSFAQATFTEMKIRPMA